MMMIEINGIFFSLLFLLPFLFPKSQCGCVQNRHDLATTTVIKIEVEDENDEKPIFSDVSQGVVLENEPSGTMVMRVQAIDKDGTSPNNLVSLVKSLSLYLFSLYLRFPWRI